MQLSEFQLQFLVAYYVDKSGYADVPKDLEEANRRAEATGGAKFEETLTRSCQRTGG